MAPSHKETFAEKGEGSGANAAGLFQVSARQNPWAGALDGVEGSSSNLLHGQLDY